jgi:hypothetical protein
MKKILEHSLYAIAIQLVLYFVFSQSLFVGALVASAFFIAREFAQAEYRYVDEFLYGSRENGMRWWYIFNPAIWDKDSFFYDMLFPCVAVFSIYFGDKYFFL